MARCLKILGFVGPCILNVRRSNIRCGAGSCLTGFPFGTGIEVVLIRLGREPMGVITFFDGKLDHGVLAY